MNDFMTIADLKKIIANLPDGMLIVIPVPYEGDVNDIDVFVKVSTAGVLESERDCEHREVFCINGASCDMDIADQVRDSFEFVTVKEVLYGKVNCDE
jgi:hypothetical protein